MSQIPRKVLGYSMLNETWGKWRQFILSHTLENRDLAGNLVDLGVSLFLNF